jgi:hypothetical protein
VSSDNADQVLREIQNIVSDATLKKVNSPSGFQPLFESGVGFWTRLLRWADTSLGGRPLDLLSHSYGDDHLLILGDIQGAQAVSEFDPYIVEDAEENWWMDSLRKARLRERGFGQLSLLGCITAWSDAGRRTIVKLAQTCRLKVFGTKDYLSAIDFDAAGLIPDKKETKLVSSVEICGGWQPPNELPPLPDDALRADRFDLDNVLAFGETKSAQLAASGTLPFAKFADWSLPRSRLPRLTKSELERLYDSVERDNGRLLPGLLTVPTHEYWIQHPNQRLGFRLMHELFEGRMLRVYTPPSAPGEFGNSAVYRVKAGKVQDYRDAMKGGGPVMSGNVLPA